MNFITLLSHERAHELIWDNIIVVQSAETWQEELDEMLYYTIRGIANEGGVNSHDADRIMCFHENLSRLFRELQKLGDRNMSGKN